MQGNSSVIATIVVGIVIILAVAVAFHDTNSSLSSLSSQNAGLKGQVTSLNQQVSSVNQQVSNLNQQISILQQKTVQVVTVSNTVVMVETTISVTTTTSVSTSTVYPVPNNVTVLFNQVNGVFDYSITAGSQTYTGSSGSTLSIHITPVFQGETITITASEYGGFGGCSPGVNTATAELFLNGQIVAHGTEYCNAATLQITYTM
jgi:hypothetical protein